MKTLKKLLFGFLALVMVVSLVTITPVKAAETGIKVVYSTAQLKKALKEKGAGTIVFRTETFNNITIPSIKAAKNKELVIFAQHSNVKNKCKLKSVTVENVNGYTEAVSGNTVYWKDSGLAEFTVAAGKSVKKLVFMEWQGMDPTYVIGKNAKIKKVVLDAYGTLSKWNSKKKTVNIKAQDIYIQGYASFYEAVYTLDKSGRLIKTENTNPYLSGKNIYKYSYDENGNLINSLLTYDDGGHTNFSDETTYKYDTQGKLTSIVSKYNSEIQYTQYSEYDKDGNRVCTYSTDKNGKKTGSTSFKYDKKGRLTETKYDVTGIVTSYKYDSAGRRTEQNEVRGQEKTNITNEYNKNGLNVRITNVTTGSDTTIYDYVYDFLGNCVYMVTKNEDEFGYVNNSTRYHYYNGDFIGDAPVYEDGFVSPVGSNLFNSKTYTSSGFTVVNDVKAFLEAVKPGAGIIIEPGYYNLSEFVENQNPDTWNKNHQYVKLVNNDVDGLEIVIEGVDDLMISGGTANREETYIAIDPRYSAVFRFENCSNLQLNSFTAGHTDRGTCEGNVIDLYNCKNVGLYGTELFGCGVLGLGIYEGSGNVRVYNSVIRDCEYGPVDIYDTTGTVEFNCCLMYGSGGGGVINPGNYEVVFKNCSFGENETNKYAFEETAKLTDCLFGEVTHYPEYGY